MTRPKGSVEGLGRDPVTHIPLRQTAAERQAQGIADVLRERNAYRDALAALVAALDKADHFIGKLEDGTFDHRSLAVVDALAAAREVLER